MNAKIDVSNVILKTDRLVMRPWRESDLDDFFEYASVDGVGEMAGWTHHSDKDESRRILKSFIDEKKTFALEYNGKVIGSLGVEEYDEDKMPELADKAGRELGFVLSKDYWGRGLMPEAVNRAINYLFDEVKLDFIICSHFAGNIRSERLQKKCGFKPYKKNKYKTQDGRIMDDCVNILYKSE